MRWINSRQAIVRGGVGLVLVGGLAAAGWGVTSAALAGGATPAPSGSRLSLAASSRDSKTDATKPAPKTHVWKGGHAFGRLGPAFGGLGPAFGPFGLLPGVAGHQAKPAIAGTVVSDSGGTIVVEDSMGFYRHIVTSSKTAYKEVGVTVSSSAIRSGTELVGTGAVASNHTDLDASTVYIVGPAIAGRVTSVSGSTIKISTPKGTSSIVTNSATIIRKGSSASSLSQVKTGDVVFAIGQQVSSTTFNASAVVTSAFENFKGLPGGPNFKGGPPPWAHGVGKVAPPSPPSSQTATAAA